MYTGGTIMVKVVGIRFKKAGKIYYFDPTDILVEKGQNVIVETARGVEFGEVVVGIKEISEDEIVAPLKCVIRIATDEDETIDRENKEKQKFAFECCLEKIDKHDLNMKLIDVEYTFDNNKIIFYFTADGRIDFRELVKDLASVFKTRIELRQIGVRDEAKMINGLGPCGRTLCCATWLGDFEPVSIKMAKEQSLSLNPTKISGICGRLMCCLKYEHDMYECMKKNLPNVGERIDTPDGEGIVVDNNVLLESVKVRLVEDKEKNKLSEDIYVYNKQEIKKNCSSCKCPSKDGQEGIKHNKESKNKSKKIKKEENK
jgi:cell fate regulator YaaT (PSP1 superfamily)